jgi:hypothetical protein
MDSDEIEVFWDMRELEALVRKLVPRGESTKIDLKVALDLSTDHSKAELLKDISAMANTLDHVNRNHGFVVLGATANALGYTQFSQSEDHLQATIDELASKGAPCLRRPAGVFPLPPCWGRAVTKGVPPTAGTSRCRVQPARGLPRWGHARNSVSARSPGRQRRGREHGAGGGGTATTIQARGRRASR